MNNPFKRKNPGEPTALENFCSVVAVIGLVGGSYWWINSPISEARIQSLAEGDPCYRAELTKALKPGYKSAEVVDGGALVGIALRCRDQRKAEERQETIARQSRALQN